MSIIPPRPDSCLIRLPRPPGERGVPVMDCSLPYEQLRERPGGVVGVPGSDTDGVPREADEEKSPARSEGCLMRGRGVTPWGSPWPGEGCPVQRLGRWASPWRGRGVGVGCICIYFTPVLSPARG